MSVLSPWHPNSFLLGFYPHPSPHPVTPMCYDLGMENKNDAVLVQVQIKDKDNNVLNEWFVEVEKETADLMLNGL